MDGRLHLAADEKAGREVAELAGAHAFHLDLRDRARPAALVAEIEKELGPIAGLVNNAAVRREAILAMTSDADWDEVLEVNLGGTFRCCRAVLPGMVYRRRGSIVNISSRSATAGLPGQSAYAASKAGLLGLSYSLAREVGRKGVRVNVIVPGFVATELTAGLAPAAVAKLRDTECLPAGTAPGDVARRWASCSRTAPPPSPDRPWPWIPERRHDLGRRRASAKPRPRPQVVPPHAPEQGGSAAGWDRST